MSSSGVSSSSSYYAGDHPRCRCQPVAPVRRKRCKSLYYEVRLAQAWYLSKKAIFVNRPKFDAERTYFRS